MLFGRWPRVGLAVRTAVAAWLAWRVALLLPVAAAEDYPYYAPLGAVVGTYPTIHSSARNSLQAVGAIIAGAVVALAVSSVLDGGSGLVPAVVGIAVLVAGWRAFGGQRAWVVSAAVFVLIVGSARPGEYVLAYSGLTLLGGLIAVAVNAVLPDVPLQRSRRALVDLAATLADQLDDVAEGLRRDEPLTTDEWHERLHALGPLRDAVRDAGEETEESLRGNVRARWSASAVHDQHVVGVVLGNLTSRVEELTTLLVEVLQPGQRDLVLGPTLRLCAADVVAGLAGTVRRFPAEGVRGAAEGLREHLQRLSAAEVAADHRTVRDRQTAGAVVTQLRRCVGALHVHAGVDDEAVLPTPWALPGEDTPPRGLRARLHRLRRRRG